ncbi:MAG: PAS domain-containing protein [Anaeromyxobacteraceae bacterium]
MSIRERPSPTWTEILMKDHELTERVFAAIEKAFAEPADPTPGLVANLREYLVSYVDRCHNQKEERALFPLLARRGIPSEGGPVAVMLAEHAQARELVDRIDAAARGYVDGDRGRLAELKAAFAAYAALNKPHYWKENDILYPLANRVLSPEDGAELVDEIEEIEQELGPSTRERYWKLAEEIVSLVELKDLSWGLAPEVLAAMLNTLPLELSFVDHEDRVRYFSHERGEKIFARSRGAIGTEVHNCHPQKSLHMVEQILSDFKAGRRTVAEFWFDMGPRKIHIRYWAVRDDAGKYLGCLETVQDVTGIQGLRGQKRLLDDAA